MKILVLKESNHSYFAAVWQKRRPFKSGEETISVFVNSGPELPNDISTYDLVLAPQKIDDASALATYSIKNNKIRIRPKSSIPISRKIVDRIIKATILPIKPLKYDREVEQKIKKKKKQKKPPAVPANPTARRHPEKTKMWVIDCMDCGKEREVYRADLFQVKRCKTCQREFNRQRSRKTRTRESEEVAVKL